MLHTCAPPIDALRRWLRQAEALNGNYGHLLLEQAVPGDQTPLAELRTYFESAHLDAREVFHAAARIDLHPDAGAPGAHAQYPGCLPSTARRGLFGEVMTGLLTESYDFVGGHEWRVPIFLFRYHGEVGAYIFDLARDPSRVRQVSGRHGNDFIALNLDGDGNVVRFIAGEAKWRTTLTASTMDEMMIGPWEGEGAERRRSNTGVWNEMNNGIAVPRGLEQLQRLLEEKEPDFYAEAIVSLDRALLLNAQPLPRTDLLVVAGDRAATRRPGTTLLPTNQPPQHYTAGRPLQVVELVLEGGTDLIDRLYASLWGHADAPA